MKKTQTVAYGLAILAFGALQCANDYNPFENYSNAQVLVLPEASSKKIRDGDTLTIFSTETLAVYTTVREKIDSFRIDAPGNRYWPDTTILHPSDKDNQIFLLSFWDTGRVQINVTTYRSDQTVFSLAAPLSYYVRSPLKQKDISAVLGSPCTLSTTPVGDNNDVLYVWAFGKDTVLGIASNTFSNPYPKLSHVEVGKTDTGYLWVTDFQKKFRSPITMFTHLFYQPSPPRIKCTNNGLHGDTVITGEDTLIFMFQVIDSSGQGFTVDLSGEQPQTLDSVTFYKTFTGMKLFSKQNPKVEIIKATNKIGQTTIDTFYLCYEATGPHGDLVRFRLVNPPGPTLTTRLDTLIYIVNVDNYSQDTVFVSTVMTGPYGKQTAILPIYSFSDSVHKCQWLVPLAPGSTAIKTQASIPQRAYDAETTLVIQHNSLAPDTTPPEITSITVNGKPYRDTTLDIDSSFVNVVVSAIDNESGIKSVSITQDVISGAPITMTYLNHVWVSNPVPFGKKQTTVLTITVRNNLWPGTNTTTTKKIILRKGPIVVTPLQ